MPPEFKLGERAVGASACVKEAKTEAFTLKNFCIKCESALLFDNDEMSLTN